MRAEKLCSSVAVVTGIVRNIFKSLCTSVSKLFMPSFPLKASQIVWTLVTSKIHVVLDIAHCCNNINTQNSFL